MGNNSITQSEDKTNRQHGQDLDWEKDSFKEGCETGRRRALKKLACIEERLFQQHPAAWRVVGWRTRLLVTRCGDVRVKRRLYREEQGDYHFLLDEYLGWQPHQLATPDIQECLVEEAVQHPFRPVGKTLEKLTAGVLSARTIHRLVQKTARLALEEEQIAWRALYNRGELPPSQERQVPILFTEGDGVFVSLQREQQQEYEVKQAIAYEGWERLAGAKESYQLVGKRVYCQGDEAIPFWGGVTVEWAKKWDLGVLKEIILGGDGANWIDGGLGEFAGSIRQLDGFHLARACGRGWQEGQLLYQAIRAGQVATARQLAVSLVPREGAGNQKARQYVEHNIEDGRDWRTQSQQAGRGLGTMEANEDKLVANRMKKRGLSWTKSGALRMNKAIQLAANGELTPFCRRRTPGKEHQRRAGSAVSRVRSDGHQKWLEAGLPALVGPHSGRPWVKGLYRLTHSPLLLN